MKKDIAIEEIHNVRKKISTKHHHNTKELIAHYKNLEKKYKDRITNKSIQLTD